MNVSAPWPLKAPSTAQLHQFSTSDRSQPVRHLMAPDAAGPRSFKSFSMRLRHGGGRDRG